MTELRLIDPNGYQVPRGIRTVTPDTETQARQELQELAVQDAALWADFGYRASQYRIL